MSETNDQNKTEPTEPDLTIGSGNESSSISPDSIEGVFLLALQKENPEERNAWLDEVCADDQPQRLRVNALLAAYDDAGSFMETPASGPVRSDEISLSFLQPSDKDGCLGILGPYEVLEVIGRGGMGLVLRAIDPKLSRVVAVKVLLPELAANPNARRRFLREAQAAAAVSHPHVVTIHAVEQAQDEVGTMTPPYLVMECVIGHSLQQKIDSVGPLRLPEIVRISQQIAEGLVAAHRQGLIHRDIKPANILLENGVERVKITDFGLARAVDDITVTRTGEVSGTPQYMSPEQASGERVDHRSDLFSLGCVMYAMCTGHSPFRGDSIAHVIKRVTHDTPRPISGQNPESPRWLAEIIDCLLQKNADERIQTTEGLVAILNQHLAMIQQPSENERHSVVNRRLPPATARNTSTDATGTQTSPIVVKWMRWLVRALFLSVSLLLIGTGYARLALGVYAGPQEMLIVLVTWSLLAFLVVRDIRSPSTAMLAFPSNGTPKPFRWLFSNQNSEQSIHARVGSYLLRGSVFFGVCPLLIMLMGIVVGDGDLMEFGGPIWAIVTPFCAIAAILGYVLRYVIDSQQESHVPLRLGAIAFLAAVVAVFGSSVVPESNSAVLTETTEGDPGGKSTSFPLAQNPIITHKMRWNPDFKPPKNSENTAATQDTFDPEIDIATYRAGPGDLLGIHVNEITTQAHQPPPMNLRSRFSVGQMAVGIPFPVMDNGRIELPFECSLEVSDLTLLEIAERIRSFYEDEQNVLNKGQSGVVVTVLEPRTSESSKWLIEYRIQPGDTLAICIDDLRRKKGEPHIPVMPPVLFPRDRSICAAIGTAYVVDNDGAVELPLAGTVPVKGLSLSEARTTILEAYTEEQQIFRASSIGYVTVTFLPPKSSESSDTP